MFCCLNLKINSLISFMFITLLFNWLSFLHVVLYPNNTIAEENRISILSSDFVSFFFRLWQAQALSQAVQRFVRDVVRFCLSYKSLVQSSVMLVKPLLMLKVSFVMCLFVKVSPCKWYMPNMRNIKLTINL